MANSIFNFDAGNTEKNTLYDHWTSQGDIPKEVNRFTRRTNATTFAEFLSRTNLTLFEETARFGPFTRTFYVLKGASAGSYFDKLLENNSVVVGAGTEADRDVRQAREEVHRERDQPLLYEEGRQAIILEYSRTHFVPRGLRGK
jgi:hypothetical protein